MVLLDFDDKVQMMAIGTICELPKCWYIHGALIDEYYYSIVVKEVLNGKICLFVINEINNRIQEHLQDVLNTTTLCRHEYIMNIG